MWVKAYVKYKNPELIEYKILFKYGKIQEVESEFFKGITPFLNNSKLADNIIVLKTYKQDISNMNCKYFIKNNVDNEVFLIYLDLNIIEYFKLKWQLKSFYIQSKELKIELMKYFIFGTIGYLIGRIL